MEEESEVERVFRRCRIGGGIGWRYRLLRGEEESKVERVFWRYRIREKRISWRYKLLKEEEESEVRRRDLPEK